MGDVKLTATVDDAAPMSRTFVWSRAYRTMRFPAAAVRKLALRIEGEPFDGLMCLTFSSSGWLSAPPE